MEYLRILFTGAFAVLACVAQPARIELLSRPDDHTRRAGGSAMSAAPELSRDGNFVLFLSDAPNLTTNPPPAKRVLNLYMTDRRTRQTTLVSVGADGQPANESIRNYEISADNSRVLLETTASNMVENDTNNATDVFVRDLALGQNILVTANTNGAVSLKGGFNATMSADGNLVTFVSGDQKLAVQPPSSPYLIARVYVRDIAAASTTALLTPDSNKLSYGRDPSISDDGRYVAFTADFYDTFTPTFWSTNLICDVPAKLTVPMASGIAAGGQGILWEPIMTPDGSFVTFGIQVGYGPVTNLIARYRVATQETELVVSNNIAYTLRPAAISADGKTILYTFNRDFFIWREGRDTVEFPLTNGVPMQLRQTFGNISLSGDGKFATFYTDQPLLPEDAGVSQFRTYLFDIDNDALSECPVASPAAPPSDPVANNDGSVILFSAIDADFDQSSEHPTQNIYAWNRASGVVDLVSQSPLSAFENSDRADSKLYEGSAVSEDGTKIVFTSRTPATDVVDTNGTWDVFLLDRTTGRKELVSVSKDGTKSSSHASRWPAISGNGNVVTFFNGDTNLVSGSTKGLLFYVREMDKGITHAVTNDFTDFSGFTIPAEPSSLRFDYDGKRVVFQTMFIRPSTYPRVYMYDVASNTVSWVSFDPAVSETPSSATSPAINRDGSIVAFYTNSIARIRRIDTGVLQNAPRPQLGSDPVAFPALMQFNQQGTALFYGAPRDFVVSWDLSSATPTVIATSCVEASVSEDGRWVALTRTNGATKLRQIYLRDSVAKVEKMISSNSVAGNTHSKTPRITPDGRFVVFQSRATNLVANDFNGTTDIFLYDRERDRLDALSAGMDGGTANSASARPVVSPDSSYVAFMSFASDIVAHDYNESSDIFAAHLRGPDTDGDSVDDRWEMAQFGSLTHDLNTDSDGDGMSDAAEFAAGTDPQQANSNLRVTDASPLTSDTITVRWTATPGRSYRVQTRAKFDTSSQWQNVTDAVIASQADAGLEIPLPLGSTELYFRVVDAN